MHIAIIWQRFLPYHIARIRRLRERCIEMGYKLSAIEVASQDDSYGFKSNTDLDNEWICCFPKTSYHEHNANEIHNKVLSVLNGLQPDIVFAPATPFPEGMAAVSYRVHSNKRMIMMDDAWEYTDRRKSVIKFIKRNIHKNIDGAFVPAPSHQHYYNDMGFSEKRIVFGVDVVDNDYYSKKSETIRLNSQVVRSSLQFNENYFLFVGRFLPRKGIKTLLEAYKKYLRYTSGVPWKMVLVGTGPYMNAIQTALDEENIIYAGARFSDELCSYYALAGILIVPSESDPWGLVVNEGMASGLPVIVSSGCGASKTLIKEGENGWIFRPRDYDALADLLVRFSTLPEDVRKRMGKKSQEIISLWSLDRFADGVLQALSISRRPPADMVANIITRLWKGHVRVY
jgi:glycosyltransferase involved in cell wall biosynthesis